MMFDGDINHDNANNDVEMHIHINRTVPTDLLPLNEKDVNKNWAEKTYYKSHLFSNTDIPGTQSDHESNLVLWMNTAKGLIKDIKWSGVEAGKRRIIHLAVHKYNLTFPTDNSTTSCEPLYPVNLNDVIEIISNPTWYNDRKVEKQAIIHELIYGITRKVHNFWLIKEEKLWMQKHNIKYETKNYKRITETRGFVYKLMNSIFSNTTIKMFKRAMFSRLGEFISVRDNAKLTQKVNNDVNSEFSIIPREFPTGKGYIIKKLDFICKDKQKIDCKSQVNIDTWIKHCVENGISLDYVIDYVSNLYRKECSKEFINDISTNTSLQDVTYHESDGCMKNKFDVSQNLNGIAGRCGFFYKCIEYLFFT